MKLHKKISRLTTRLSQAISMAVFTLGAVANAGEDIRHELAAATSADRIEHDIV
jgi:hypothetical protein